MTGAISEQLEPMGKKRGKSLPTVGKIIIIIHIQ